jgi:Protein of unknown function (DUF1194)/PEP-CTERM motif
MEESLMNVLKRARLLTGLTVLALFVAAKPALATPVGVELLLLVDVSGSVDSTEYQLQKSGYIQAFQSASIQAQIASITGGIAVSYVEWSSASEQAVLVGWSHVTDATSSNAFAAAINGTNRAFGGGTAPGSAINFGAPLFNNNGFEGLRLVMDVSGDGAQNDGANTLTAATNAHNAGITINGLAILGESGLQAFYQNSIVTPGGGTLFIANGFNDFAGAVSDKIGQEINPEPVPEPATLTLLGIGLSAAAARRRLKNRSKKV